MRVLDGNQPRHADDECPFGVSRVGLMRRRRSRMSALPPIASELWRRRKSTQGANSRPEQVQQTEQAYSITSSARAMSVGGTVMPSAFAVFILITSSNLVGCRIGKSAGFSPLRIRPT